MPSQAQRTALFLLSCLALSSSPVQSAEENEVQKALNVQENAVDVASLLQGTLMDKLQEALAMNQEETAEEEEEHVVAQTSFIQVSNQQAALVQQHTKMSFTCFEMKDKATCDSQYCMWKDDACTISPASYGLLCSFYCDIPSCVQTASENSPPGQANCPVRPDITASLCPAITGADQCKNQSGLCMWSESESACEDTPSCCTKAETYCRRKTKANLNRAVKGCVGLANAKNMCNYAKKCDAPPVQ
jgi:hypothetical protein